MVEHTHIKESSLSDFLLKLHRDQKTGVLSVMDGKTAIKIYLREGKVMHAEGLESDKRLLEEISKKKGLDPKQFYELIQIKERNPHSLGQALIEGGLLSRSLWDRFVALKAKNHLAAVLQVKDPELEFSESEWLISSINAVNRDLIELLLETIRGIKNKAHLEKYIPGLNACFVQTGKTSELRDLVPLSTVEQTCLSMVDGERTVGEILNVAGLRQGALYRAFYPLIFFGLIYPADFKGPETHYHEIINLYLDLLSILESNLRKEIGRQFDLVFDQCKNELSEQGKTLLHDLVLTEKPYEKIAKRIYGRFSELLGPDGSPLALASSFNELLHILILRMKKTLGILVTGQALSEMITMVGYVKKYSEDVELMKFVRGNLEDYLKEIKS
ncbi:MAG: DUF4388 domain-containing protein [Desulfobacterales bacterium]|nr:DUF4388 domain-containing protein [Desulfobacterales bacterium]